MSSNETPRVEEYDFLYQQTSLIFNRDYTGDDRPRPRKRRKLDRSASGSPTLSERTSALCFPVLLEGRESIECVKRRQKLYHDTWESTEAKIQSILHDANQATVDEVIAFVDRQNDHRFNRHIPTGLIVTGPNIASQELLFAQLADELRSKSKTAVVVLQSGDAQNLKSLLKKVIKDATTSSHYEEDDIEEGLGHDANFPYQSRKFLNYDLQSVSNYFKTSGFENLVIAVQDSEGFDTGVLTDFISIIQSWSDRIPFTSIFGVATSIELFHERLPRHVIRSLHGQQFNVEIANETLGRILRDVILPSSVVVRLGSTILDSLLERQQEQVQSLQAFVASLKYAYMCHFYANPLSILLVKSEDSSEVLSMLQPEHLEAIRMLSSFKLHVEQLLENERVAHAKALLQSDEALLEEIRLILYDASDSNIYESLSSMTHNLELLSFTATMVGHESCSSATLYAHACRGSLQGANTIEQILSRVKHLKSSTICRGLKSMNEYLLSRAVVSADCHSMARPQATSKEIVRILGMLEAFADNAELPKSRGVWGKKALRTTVVSNKAQLADVQSSLSESEIAYAKVIEELLDFLSDLFTFPIPQTMLLNEIWLYDNKSPYREVFTPRPRFAVERALCVPHDYLSCACCRASEEGLSASQPPTAILYQLYLETGGLLNVYDLWSAFFTIMGSEGDESNERTILVLFYRGLADLKLLGMVKQSRKKVDHLTKLAWKGL